VNPGISVVICCHNSANRLPETLRHLANQRVGNGMPWEVIVVDNASTDSTTDVATEFWRRQGTPAPLQVLLEPRAGLTFARQSGLATARYEIVVFVDDDNWLAPDYLQIAHDLMLEHREAGVAGGFITPMYEAPPPRWFAELQAYFAVGPQARRSGDITRDRPNLAGAGLILRKAAYEELRRCEFEFLLSDRTGDQISGGGDTELCYALVLLGYRVLYDDRLRLTHLIPKTRLRKEYLRQMLRDSSHVNTVIGAYDDVWKGRRSVIGSLSTRALLLLFWTIKSLAKSLLGKGSWFVTEVHMELLWSAMRTFIADYVLRRRLVGKVRQLKVRISKLHYPAPRHPKTCQ